MSGTLRVALAQLNQRVGDLAANLDRIREAVDRASDRHADLVVFPELALSGYPPRDLLTREAFVDAQLAALEEVAALSGDANTGIVLGAFDRNPEPRGKPLRNLAVVCRDGEVVARIQKRLLPTYDVFEEDRYFAPGDRGTTVEFEGVDLGITVCEDAWNEPDVWERPLYDADPIEDVVAAGADLLVNISASPFAVEKAGFRRELMRSHASDHDRPLAFVNQVGANDDVVFDGRSLVVDSDGAVACRLAEFESDLAVCDFSLDGTSPAPVLEDGDGGETGALAPVASGRPERIAGAIELGIADYFRKSGFEGAVVGLSGGIDSSVTAALAARALGPENVLGVAMPTRYTSSESTEDARRLAENLGIDFEVVPIEEPFEAFLDELKGVFGGDPGGLTEENVQPRVRGTVLMALANEFDRLVLAPGNKSELSVGYCTLYGDMVGALAPIADCYKGDVYDLAAYCNRQETVVPKRVIERPPSAELRPDQTDEADLPPYSALDDVLQGYLDRGETAKELVAGGADPAVVREALQRLHRSEYKRRQAPPVLKLTPKALGLGWRYPIAASYDALVPDGS